MQPAPALKTKKVLLRKGMKFSAIVDRPRGEGKNRSKVKRKRFVGPCEVEMTDAQIKAFKDLLQTGPHEVVVVEPKPETKQPTA